MKISASALVIVLSSLLPSLSSSGSFALASPLALENGSTPSTTTHRLSKRSCGSTNFCSASQRYPGCVDWSVGYQLCSLKYVQGGRKQQICMYCVEMNCNDSLCDKLFAS
ncbi:hypothetical protein VTO42DRAFT_923 [Malbranchea cinnamomea]